VREYRQNTESIVQEFPKLLEKALGEEGNPSRRQLLLIIDGLNKLDRRDNAMDLVWLPSSLPSTVRLLVSTTPGTPLSSLS
jgi:hypothetical protein